MNERLKNRIVPIVVAVLAVTGGVAAIGASPHETTIGAYSTSITQRTRSQRFNARLALGRLVGAVIPAGQDFSFNGRVGTFSRDQGFRKAPVSYNGQLIDDWGGGVCQTSTTLYNAALLAGMQIIERNRHQFAPSYVPPGRDAAVAYSNIDLRFRNPYDYPVRIDGRIEGGRLMISLIGQAPLKVRPEVVSDVQSIEDPTTFEVGAPNGRRRVRNTGKLGCNVAVYRITGKVRELISEDNYPAMNRVVEVRADP